MIAEYELETEFRLHGEIEETSTHVGRIDSGAPGGTRVSC